jgi:Flp pilus assembly protein CpaB
MVTRATTSRTGRYYSTGNLIGVMAIVCGVGSAAYLAGKGLTAPPAREPYKAFVPEYNSVEIPVPMHPVPAGTLVRDIRTRIERYPDHQLPKGALRDLKFMADSVTLVALPGGLPIMEANLGNQEEATNPILGRIPPGMRAMTVKVDATSAVEGWARSGSVVDVLLIEKARTTVIAERVRVISAERSLAPVDLSRGQGSGIPSTATLLVTQEQCLAINTAVPLGRIAFALRSSKDEDSWRDTRFSSDDLSPGKKQTTKTRVDGVVAFGHGDQRKQYALVEGEWIATDTLPAGFSIGAHSGHGGLADVD